MRLKKGPNFDECTTACKIPLCGGVMCNLPVLSQQNYVRKRLAWRISTNLMIIFIITNCGQEGNPQATKYDCSDLWYIGKMKSCEILKGL